MDGCSPQCKHWRSNILRACKALAWTIPDEVALLRGAMFETKMDPEWYWIDSPYFEPQNSRSNPPAIVQAPPIKTLYTPDKDYQAMLDIAASMFSHLPPDWSSRYEQEIGNRTSTEYTVLESVIRKTQHDLGISSGFLDRRRRLKSLLARFKS